MDLLDQLCHMRDHEAVLLTRPEFELVDQQSLHHDLMLRAVTLIAGASDPDLLAAFKRACCDRGEPEADLLAKEIGRRGLLVQWPLNLPSGSEPLSWRRQVSLRTSQPFGNGCSTRLP